MAVTVTTCEVLVEEPANHASVDDLAEVHPVVEARKNVPGRVVENRPAPEKKRAARSGLSVATVAAAAGVLVLVLIAALLFLYAAWIVMLFDLHFFLALFASQIRVTSASFNAASLPASHFVSAR